MTRTPRTDLLPAALRARLEAGDVTNGQYHDLLVTLPTAALVDHLEVYLQHVARDFVIDEPADARSAFYDFVVPEMVARFSGKLVRHNPVNGDSAFWERVPPATAAVVKDRSRRAGDYRAELAAMSDGEFASVAEKAREAVPCRWNLRDLVYDASVLLHIAPELIDRLRARSVEAEPAYH